MKNLKNKIVAFSGISVAGGFTSANAALTAPTISYTDIETAGTAALAVAAVIMLLRAAKSLFR